MNYGFIIFILVFSTILSNFIFFDIILKIQREKYKEIWIEEGKTVGFFDGKGNFPFITEQINRSARLFSWTFITDDWMKNEKKVVWLLRISRFNFVIFFICWIAVILNLSTAKN